ncbi:ABC transporter ATP-binding protein [Pontibacter sp. G13]|uniref:ABC transporter ATP-binding protein n=1 Tax=Pontibacter sp. G13 TaxID=3074898 RepID=UPI00288BEE4A|nr:ABC transporter ATP-binding protein [Pontibacter sp. G13]WNJ21004.1 ABC transporter ATP-binding protein [Pontibacter sp. G13]
MLQASDIQKSYGQVPVLKGVDMQLSEGEVVALVGKSGAGKSTLLQILGTLDRPDQGSVQFDGKNILSMGERETAEFRNESLGFVFQFHNLLPEFTAVENVCMPAFIQGANKISAMEKGKELLVNLGLGHRLDHKPTQMSGGEQQRVAVARSLINSPKLVLADEPTGNLDTQNSEALYEIIFGMARQMGVGFLIATHNQEMARQADRVIHIQDGVLVDL